MFKAMLAAAGGVESDPPVATKVKPTTSNAKKPKQVSLNASDKPPTQTQPTQEPYKPKTFSELKGLREAQSQKLKPSTSSPSNPSTRPAPRVVPRSPARPAIKASTGKPLRTTTHPASAPAAAPKAKKMDFNQLMNMAGQVDGKQLAMGVKTKTREQTQAAREQHSMARKRASVSPKTDLRSQSRQSIASKATATAIPAVAQHNRLGTSREKLAPAPAARPSAELLAKRKNKRVHEADSDLDDFVVHEDNSGQSYRDQIWEALGRRPARAYEDYSSDDDMEATGADIFEEERRSALLARKEDEEQERILARHAAEKLARKKKKT